MTKQEFLDKLRAALSGRVSTRAVAENISFYEDYINTQVRMGKSETQVIEELGDPRLLARSIAEAEKRAGLGSSQEAEYTTADSGYREGQRGYGYGSGQRGNARQSGYDYGSEQRGNARQGGYDYGSGQYGYGTGSRSGSRGGRIPIWLVICIVLLVVVLVLSLVFSVLSFLAPILIPIMLIVFAMRLLSRRL